MPKVYIVAPDDLPIPPIRGGSVQIYLDALSQEFATISSIERKVLCPGHGKTQKTGSPYVYVAKSKDDYLNTCIGALQRATPEIVQIENRPSWVLRLQALKWAPKIVLNLHSTTFLGPQHVRYEAARHALQRADAVVLNSHYLKNEISDRFRLKKTDWSPTVIYPGVAINDFRPVDVSTRNTFEPLKLLFVGRVIRQKGVHLLIPMVKILTHQGIAVQLKIVGRTPPWEQTYRKNLVRQIGSLPIQMVGFLPRSRITEVYQKANVFLCPSQRDEAFGLVNVEAMAAGLPVVASHLGGISEIVTKETGILVQQYTRPMAFARAVSMLAQQPEKRMHFGANGRQRAAQFTWNQTAHRFSTLYTELSRR